MVDFAEDSELRESIQREIAFPSYKQKIYFVKTNEHFTLDVRKHKHHFLNSIDLEFPESFTHNFSVAVNSEVSELGLLWLLIVFFFKCPINIMIFNLGH